VTLLHMLAVYNERFDTPRNRLKAAELSLVSAHHGFCIDCLRSSGGHAVIGKKTALFELLLVQGSQPSLLGE